VAERQKTQKTGKNTVNPLMTLGAALAVIHFAAPLAYYAAARRWLRLPWGVRRDPAHTPTVTVAIPTYNKTGQEGA